MDAIQLAASIQELAECHLPRCSGECRECVYLAYTKQRNAKDARIKELEAELAEWDVIGADALLIGESALAAIRRLHAIVDECIRNLGNGAFDGTHLTWLPPERPGPCGDFPEGADFPLLVAEAERQSQSGEVK